MRGNDSWGCGGGVLSFLFFAAELSSAFSFLIFVILANAGTHRIASAVARFSRFIVAAGFVSVVVCRGGVLSFLFFAAELSSAFSFLIFVILANAGTHRIASAVACFWHFIIRVVVGFAFVVVCCGEYISKRGFWHMWMNGSPYTRE
ncbi:hypothetical protein MO988_17165 [Vibrio vulnificus]|uniref:hypothetical protein n=1 Tax=Vibrio vulnificus TaxID=672 RepID=UPI001FACA99F|nr:hypothetical protein [Vibrio vulnificus]MCJ0823125.1 hypothetical protein [Vibrio vulnificus]